jgi:hypothetical protein
MVFAKGSRPNIAPEGAGGLELTLAAPQWRDPLHDGAFFFTPLL